MRHTTVLKIAKNIYCFHKGCCSAAVSTALASLLHQCWSTVMFHKRECLMLTVRLIAAVVYSGGFLLQRVLFKGTSLVWLIAGCGVVVNAWCTSCC